MKGIIMGALVLGGLGVAAASMAKPKAINHETPPEGSIPEAGLPGYAGPGLTLQTAASGHAYQVWAWIREGASYQVARLAGTTLWISFGQVTGGARTAAKSNAKDAPEYLTIMKADWGLA